MRSGKRNPTLSREHAMVACARALWGAFELRNSAPCRHQVHGSRFDLHSIAFAISMHDAAVEQVCHSCQSDMRMRPHVHALASY